MSALLEALLAVQKDAPTLPKDATNPHFRSKYTPLDTIVETMGPILNTHGLIWTTLPVSADGEPALTYRLSHAESGESLEGTMPLLLSKQDAQGHGSAITYARRYALCAVLNLVADDDDDGNAASSQAREPQTTSIASEKQIKYVTTLLKRNKVTNAELAALLNGAGVKLGERLPAEAVKFLSPRQATSMIDALKDGPVPGGWSDVPSDASGFVVDPVAEVDRLPVA